MACRTFPHIGTVGVDYLIDLQANIDNARDFGPARKVVLLGDGVRLETSRDLFRIIMRAARHPACRFDSLRYRVVVGILFIMRPVIPRDHRIRLYQPDN